jgi:hypothetical protein
MRVHPHDLFVLAVLAMACLSCVRHERPRDLSRPARGYQGMIELVTFVT